jgi:hypothetical protein
MALMITVRDPLAQELKSAADERNVAVEQFANELLGQAVRAREWPGANHRRLALIRKQFTEGLTGAEAKELQELQCQADRHLEALDAEMLNDVSSMERAATEALHGSSS